jgi:hypothetical protein
MERIEYITNKQAKNSHLLRSGRDYIDLTLTPKDMVETLRIQWKRFWRERLNDKLKAGNKTTTKLVLNVCSTLEPHQGLLTVLRGGLQ